MLSHSCTTFESVRTRIEGLVRKTAKRDQRNVQFSTIDQRTYISDEMKGLLAREKDRQKGENVVRSLMTAFALCFVFGLPIEHCFVQCRGLTQ